MSAGTVIGCVHGAWWLLRERLGDNAPTYQWCEQQWTGGLARTLASQIGTKAMPGCLADELAGRWASGDHFAQPSLFEVTS